MPTGREEPVGLLTSLTKDRLTRAQYVGLLGQCYHLAIHVPLNLRVAADHVTDPALSQWLREHAADDDGHHEWASLDLADLGASVQPPTKQTRALLEHIRTLVANDRAYTVLGWVHVAAHVGAEVIADESLPGDIGNATRFIRRQSHVDERLVRDVEQAISSLSDEQRGDVRQQIDLFTDLYQEFFAAATVDPAARPQSLAHA